jgi:PAS domain S-box-containing protein
MNESDLAKFADTVPVQLWSARPDGTLNFVNATVTDYFGRSAHDILGEGWLSYLHPADVAPTIEQWTHSLRTGEAYRMEFRLQRDADRLHYWHLAEAFPVRNADGDIVGWSGSNTNINGLKRMVEVAEARQEVVRRERDRLARAFQSSPAAVALYSGPNFVIDMVNQKWAEFSGKHNVVGQPVRTVFPEMEGKGLFEIMEHVYRTGETYRAIEMMIVYDRNGDGQPEPTYWNAVLQPLSEPGDPVQELLGHAVEVTDAVVARQRNEELARENDRLRDDTVVRR